MDESTLLIGLCRSLAMSALVILGYSRVIQATTGAVAGNIGVGFLFAAAGILSMNDPVIFAPGVFYDGRVPILALAYTFSGLAGAMITAIVLGGYRIWLGGAGVYAGLISISVTAAAGIAVGMIPNRFFRQRLGRPAALSAAATMSTVSVLALPHLSVASFNYHAVMLIMIANPIGIFLLHDFLSNEGKRMRLFRALEHDAAVDPLTKLVNRRAFDAKAALALSLGHNPNGEYSVIMIDIDHFKAVNDTFGHDTGDTVLMNVASIIAASVRKADIVARFGGEEIAVLLPGLGSQKAAAVAEKIRLRVEANIVTSQAGGVSVTISAGASATNIHRTEVAEALKAADAALYTAKRSGRNRVEMAFAA
ncbi:diguanylate cyclase (plasmid) [Rhizobium lusitanum]|uniref:GGDEF domain-containing protein n=1 Tax=Rhizobium lusitanum TaxID=293958 RepID=UPI0016154D3C|nr:diguanylate cyclase [Rhizobium lusitanum]QND44475.1 diguanylate cyclase [Rhizobium lusitanum]QND44580.1 diguanylate cyclase [Rhizobium lusitanum]